MIRHKRPNFMQFSLVIHSDKTDEQKPVCIAVTRSTLCLATENYRIPIPKVTEGRKGYSEGKDTQFTYVDSIDVTDIMRVVNTNTNNNQQNK